MAKTSPKIRYSGPLAAPVAFSEAPLAARFLGAAHVVDAQIVQSGAVCADFHCGRNLASACQRGCQRLMKSSWLTRAARCASCMAPCAACAGSVAYNAAMKSTSFCIRRSFIVFALCVGLFSAHAPVARTPEAAAPRGYLLIVGGGDTPPDAQIRFVALAGGAGRARVAVFPMASTSGDEEAVEVADELRAMGATATVLNLSRADAESEAFAERLADFDGFWFCGGDQVRLAEILRATPALASIQRRYFAGGVVGGTSAGAAVMSTAMLTGNRYRDPDENEADAADDEDTIPRIARGVFEVAEGFGFLPGAIVDQHFLRRARHNRLLSAVLERPGLLGVGIDEGAAILVHPDRRWEILGNSYVKVFDARRAQITTSEEPILGSSDITLHLLPSRSIYDPSSGRTSLPAS